MLRSTILLLIILLPAFQVLAQVDNATILRRLQTVPVLCYHQVRDWKATDSRSSRAYIIPPAAFNAHMQALQQAGFHSILPGQLLAYLLSGDKLPSRPILISFDDGTASQYEAALPVLDRVGYKAIFFIMTVVLNKPGYLSSTQLKTLHASGHIIGCHTWDHHDVRKYAAADWRMQLEQPGKDLQRITGTTVRYFAYPFGAWNDVAFPYLQQQGYAMAFQLWAPLHKTSPLYTIRRILVDGNWTSTQLLGQIAARYPDAR